ncbi:MAG: tRNA glutamyl-Q(34) synthetase GluQRS [Kiritimatiellae bacterium]|nr:tRNA glutamyl-Q(34) synthetase GluQRS [Kiritimatiellia bacterium]
MQGAHYVGRLAPSPTGALHLGNIRTFVVAWLRARQMRGRLILRIEDLDHPRHKDGAAVQALEDLKWLGFDWDCEYVQSQRTHLYGKALEKLQSMGLVYPCVCSRKDVQSAQSAPHAGEQLYYPGICRERFSSWGEACDFMNSNPTSGDAQNRIPCWRFRVDECGEVSFTDNFAGEFRMDVNKCIGDFPLARDRSGAGYALAVVVDDAEMGVTEVVRGDDLLPATPQQLLVYRALGLREPSFFHVPLVVGQDGRRLAKRHGDTRIASFRERGVSAENIIGYIAHSLGIVSQVKPVKLYDLVDIFDEFKIPPKPLVYDLHL